MSRNINMQRWSERVYQRKMDMEPMEKYLKVVQKEKEKVQTFQKRYDYHISQKYEAMAGNYDGWSSSTDARNHHALSASLVYQNALTAGIRLKVEGE
ncbi:MULTISPECIES: hypothetical protein [Bacillus]|uniref:hypothetical protein n=1 Tax=Bacillus TaxID=1386 RepID=UPI001C21D647|nr:hypothetical protein [Bacillus pumilus]MBU8607842.1 hypothetical protein [Bacillus pumilus]MCY7500166.1 hypothetical protein [Bacillus pumilus]MCY7528510.1 hypothetical protein [Bacillus pumilus]MED4439532.1 hypothetical protein [Bacillus pumilus]MED4489975.1 hypothetical protein [Bacillus pumilus]